MDFLEEKRDAMAKVDSMLEFQHEPSVFIVCEDQDGEEIEVYLCQRCGVLYEEGPGNVCLAKKLSKEVGDGQKDKGCTE